MSEEFARVIATRDIRFKHAKGMRDIYGKELHVYHEIFFFIAGDAEFVSELGTRKLSPFTTVIIPKDTFHSFVVYGSEADYCRCVLNFESVSELDELINAKLKNVFVTTDVNVTELFLKMQALEGSALSQMEREILLKALFAQLLVVLNEKESSFFDVLISRLRVSSKISKNRFPQKSWQICCIFPNPIWHTYLKRTCISLFTNICWKNA